MVKKMWFCFSHLQLFVTHLFLKQTLYMRIDDIINKYFQNNHFKCIFVYLTLHQKNLCILRVNAIQGDTKMCIMCQLCLNNRWLNIRWWQDFLFEPSCTWNKLRGSSQRRQLFRMVLHGYFLHTATLSYIWPESTSHLINLCLLHIWSILLNS